MSQSDIIVLLVLALAFGAWAFFAEVRIRKLQGQLAVSQEEIKDAEIVVQTHTLSDADLDSKMSDFVGRSKPPA